MIDKNNIISQLPSINDLVLELGCGSFKKNTAWIGIDIRDAPGVDIVGDVFEVIKAFPDNSVNAIHAFHFFEHITDVPELLKELSRVLKAAGNIEIAVPHFSNPYFYSDLTHKNYFGLYSFSYFVKDELLVHKVPDSLANSNLQLKSVKLCFSSPLYINRPFRRLLQLVFNVSNLMKEWYEDSWCRSFPCYEIRFILIKK